MKLLKRVRKSSKSNKKEQLTWVEAPDVKKRLKYLISGSGLTWKNKGTIYVYRSTGSSARAYARIWGLSRIWQQALGETPAYVIEVISEKFDKLTDAQKDDVLMHELAHIPQTFSGSLVPHIRHGKRKFHDRVKRIQFQFRKRG